MNDDALERIGDVDEIDDQNKVEITVEKVVSEIKTALSAIKGAVEDIQFKKATITLLTVVKRSLGWSLKFFILTFGRRVEKEHTQKIIINLEPGDVRDLAAGEEPKLSQKLVDAVVGAVNGVKKSAPEFRFSGEDGLQVDFSFVVVVESSGEVGFEFEVVPVHVKLNAKHLRTGTHTLSLTFVGQS